MLRYSLDSDFPLLHALEKIPQAKQMVYVTGLEPRDQLSEPTSLRKGQRNRVSHWRRRVPHTRMVI